MFIEAIFPMLPCPQAFTHTLLFLLTLICCWGGVWCHVYWLTTGGLISSLLDKQKKDEKEEGRGWEGGRGGEREGGRSEGEKEGGKRNLNKELHLSHVLTFPRLRPWSAEVFLEANFLVPPFFRHSYT